MFLSLWSKFRGRRTGAARFLIAAPALAAVFFASAPAAFDSPALPDAAVTDEDVITLLSLELGGKDIAGIAWENMNPFEMQSARDRAALIASMADAARRCGIDGAPEVERAVRWGTNVLLAEEWKKKTVASIDFSEEAVDAFYRANIDRYRQSEAVFCRKAYWPAKGKKAVANAKARAAAAQAEKTPLSRLENVLPEEWIPLDDLTPEVAKILREAPLDSVVGPVEISGGVMLFEVLNRRGMQPVPSGSVPEHTVLEQIKEDMIRTAVKEGLR